MLFIYRTNYKGLGMDKVPTKTHIIKYFVNLLYLIKTYNIFFLNKKNLNDPIICRHWVHLARASL